jgi:hypothetical protein
MFHFADSYLPAVTSISESGTDYLYRVEGVRRTVLTPNEPS